MNEELTRLGAIQSEIAALEAERDERLVELDATIARLRHAGTTWHEINAVCGTTNIQVSWQRRRDRLAGMAR